MQNKMQNNCNSICSQLFLPRRSGLPRRPSSSTARFHIFRGDDRCVVLKLLEYTGQHCPIENLASHCSSFLYGAPGAGGGAIGAAMGAVGDITGPGGAIIGPVGIPYPI